MRVLWGIEKPQSVVCGVCDDNAGSQGVASGCEEKIRETGRGNEGRDWGMSRQKPRKACREYKGTPIPGEPPTPTMDKVRRDHQKKPGGHWRYIRSLLSKQANGLATKSEIKTLDDFFAESAALNEFHFPRHDPDEKEGDAA
jgi:hypothetical protein